MSNALSLLTRRSTMLGTQQSGGGGIPSDYEVLEYVANNQGDRYAKYVTDFVPTTTCKVEVDVEVVGTTSSRVGAWFGSRSGWNNNAFYFMVETSSTTAGFKSIRSISTEAKWATAGRHTYAIDAGKFVVDGDVIAEYNDVFTPTFPIYKEEELIYQSISGTTYGKNLKDGVHPTEVGYIKLGEMMTSALISNFM